jgi:hypothetical protein
VQIDESNRYAFFPLFLAGCLFILLAPVFWTGTELPPGRHVARAHENADLYNRVYPQYAAAFGRLRRGELPLWDPFQWCGVPLHADASLGLFQPLNLGFLFLPTGRAMAVHTFLSLFLMGFFFTLFARAAGMRWTAAVTGGLVWAFSGGAAAAMYRPALIGTLVWAPLLFLAVREYCRFRRMHWLLAAGAAAGLMLLAGAPAVALAMLAAGLCYPLAHLFRKPAPAFPQTGKPERSGLHFRDLAAPLIITVIGFGLSAVHWLPVLVYEGGFWRDAAVHALAGAFPRRLLDLPMHMLEPQSEVLPSVMYGGVVTCILLLPGLCNRNARRDVIFFLLLALAAGYAAVTGNRSGAASFPGRSFFFPALFGLACIAAAGMDCIYATGHDPWSPGRRLARFLALAVAVFLLAAGSGPPRGKAVFFLAIFIPFLVIRIRLAGLICALLTVLLLFTDLSTAGANYFQHPWSDARAVLNNNRAELRAIREQSIAGRALICTQPLKQEMPPGFGVLAPVRMANGAGINVPPQHRAWWRRLLGADWPESGIITPGMLRDAAHPGLLRFMAVDCLFSPEEELLDGDLVRALDLHPARTVDGGHLYTVGSSLPRVFRTPAWSAAGDTETALDKLLAPGFDAARCCIVQPDAADFEALIAAVPDTGMSETPGADGNAAITAEYPGKIIIRTAGSRPGLVVVNDSFDPGWIAAVDGKRTPVIRANGLFRGIPVPSGSCEIVLRYRPLPFYTGAAISLITLALICAAGCRLLFFRS